MACGLAVFIKNACAGRTTIDDEDYIWFNQQINNKKHSQSINLFYCILNRVLYLLKSIWILQKIISHFKTYSFFNIVLVIMSWTLNNIYL